MWKGKIRHTIWLTMDDTIQYNELAKRKGIAPNVIQSMILHNALKQICNECSMPKLICSCEYVTCKVCNKQYIKGKGFTNRLCSEECAKAWYNS